tara:strand:- start:6300 stop:9506 length:3207 start_codon:yes stop_codon:yes gene_type:complete
MSVLTAVGTILMGRMEEARTQAVFDSYAQDSFQSLNSRIDGFARALDGAGAFFAASTFVSEQDWQNYVETLDIKKNLPGVLGVGFISLVKEGDDSGFRQQSLSLGYSPPPIHPDTGQPEKFVIEYIEPIETNRPAVGLDIGFEEGRKAAALRARETNTVQLTSPIKLVQDNESKAGFLLLRPMYDLGADLSSPKDREAAFNGWVYLPFVASALFHELSPHEVSVSALHAYETGNPDGDTQFHEDTLQAENLSPRFRATRDVFIFGRNWSLTWASTAAFEQANYGYAKWIVVASGIALVSLVAIILRVIANRDLRVRNDVQRRTKELRAKSEETQSVIENAVIAIFVLDQNDRIVSANQAAQSLLAVSSNDIGKPIQRLIKIQATSDDTLGAAQPARAPNAPDLRLKVQKNVWTTANGSPRTTLLVQDVSESEASARKLQDSEARWNLALEGAQIGVFDVDLETNRSVVSDTWRKLMQISDDATEQDTQDQFLARVHPDDLVAMLAADTDCIDGLTDRSISEYRMRFDGEPDRWMRSDAVVVSRNAQGKALRLIGAQTDATALHEAREALRASRERFELLLEQAPVGMAIFSAKGRFIGKNDALCRMTGFTEEEMLENLKFQDLVSSADYISILRAIRAAKTEQLSSYQNEYKIIPKVGPPIWGLLSVSWTFDLIEKAEVFIVQINDITEKKNIDKMKSEFVATVSHELRTPLTSIKGALGLLRGPMLENMPPSAERLLEIAASNTERLSALVNDILDLERIRSGETAFQIEPCDLAALLSEVMEQMLPFAVQHKVLFVLEAPSEEVIAMIDGKRTQQLVVNLLSNACKYSYNDTEVHIRLETVAGQALVCILNSGPVITDEFKSRIFRPFSQADASDTRASGGTGLGLNISRQIVERMDGQIGFESKIGAPTVFWFTVPLSHEGRSTSREVKHTSPEVKSVEPLEQRSVSQNLMFKMLHLEDDSDFAEIIKRSLTDKAQMTNVRTLAQAREAIKSDTFDLVVIDWDLPDGDGRDFIDDVAKQQPQARIISLSATDSVIRDLRIDHEMVKSRANLDDIVAKMVNTALTA